MKTFFLVAGGVYGMLSIILGAFGAHAFKKILTPENLENFNTAVRYEMYAALFLLLVGFFLNFDTGLQKSIGWLMLIGALFFSGSIYLLSFQEVWNVNLKFLWPVTPLGGLLMILSWALLIFYFLKAKP